MSACSSDLITHQIAIDLRCTHSFTYEYNCRAEFDYVSERCCVFYRCGRSEIRTVGGHDNCQTEHIIDKYRADIAVLSDGNVTGVIEVCNTHETDKEKWTYLNKNKIPCLEIDAQSVIDVHLRDRKHVECLFDNLHMFLDCKQCQRLKKEAQSKCIIKSLPWIAGKTYFKEVVQNIYRLPVLDDSRLEGMCRKLSALDGDYIWSRLRTPGYTPEIVFNIYRILELEGGLSK